MTVPQLRLRISPSVPKLRVRVVPRINPLEAELRNNGTHVQWRIGASGTWVDLIEIDELGESAANAAAAAASAAAAAISATAASTAETNAETAEANAETAEANAETAQTAAEAAQTAAETAEANAETAQTAAEAAQTAAELAETNAETAETNAETAATNASNSASAAGTAQTAAELAETNAETAQAAAEAAQVLAEAWASEDEDVEVTAGEFSAKHWAAKAEASASSVTSVNGETGAVVLDAGDIGFTPAGGLAATDVQAALEELDTEKGTGDGDVSAASNIGDNALVVGDGGAKGIKAHASGAPGTAAFANTGDFATAAHAASTSNPHSVTKTQVGLGNVDNTSDATKNAATATLTNKTLTDPAIIGAILEDVFTITDGAGFEIDPGNGSIQLVTLGANRTPAATNFAAGESVTLMVNDGTARTITWSTVGVVWTGGSAPTLATSGYTVIELWKVSTTIYGAHVGDVA